MCETFRFHRTKPGEYQVSYAGEVIGWIERKDGLWQAQLGVYEDYALVSEEYTRQDSAEAILRARQAEAVKEEDKDV